MGNALVSAIKAAVAVTTGAAGFDNRVPVGSLAPKQTPPSPAVREGMLREHRRLASEIHDGALQQVTCALTAIRQAERLLSQDHPAFGPLRDSLDFTQAAIESIRDTLYPLNVRPQTSSGLATRLHRLLRGISIASPAQIRVETLPDLFDAPALEEALAGIIGEAVTNAVKHASARNVWVRCGVADNAVTATVRDDGIGFDAAETMRHAPAHRHLGLFLMRDRAQRVGGDLTIESRPNEGTAVRARVPLVPAVAGARGLVSGVSAPGRTVHR